VHTSELAPPETSARTFEDLFAEHYPRLVRTLLRLIGSPAQAEELASEAFYRLYRQESRNETSIGWLYRTALNLGLDTLRADSRRVRREQHVSRESYMIQSTENPLNDLLAEERRDRVRAVIAQMKPIQGQVLLMGSSGYSCREIACALGIKTDSLYVLIARAKAQFERKYLRLYGRAE
jgi:RNA polymerase sigma-70 factor (ECF subfamily)